MEEELPDPPKPTWGVKPADTATILYGRFMEHLQHATAVWNESLEPGEKLNPDKLDALSEELGQYFESWFMRGFPPIDKER